MTVIGAFLFVACNRSVPPVQATEAARAAATDSSNPYAGGVSYPWSDRLDSTTGSSGARASSLTAQSLKTSAQPLDLSALDWSGASSSWGPVEKNTSNGEQAAGDGRPLKIRGEVFPLGLGVHANSEVQYTLGGQCDLFSASVGVDDETGERGSVVFEVWNGATKLYDSGPVRGGEAARPVQLKINGTDVLRLVVTDAGDGIDYDHADWGAARLNCPSTAPTTGLNQLGDLGWLSATNGWGPAEKNTSNGEQAAGDGRPLTLRGKVHAKGLGVAPASELVYDLGGTCNHFQAEVGVDDEVGARGSVNFQVWSGAAGTAGSSLLYESGLMRGGDTARKVNLNLKGVQALRLVVTDGGDGPDYDHADWADAQVSCGATSFGTELGYQPMAEQPYGIAEAQVQGLNGQMYVFGGFDILKPLDTPTGFNPTPSSRAYRYDPAQDTWTALATMPDGGTSHAGITTDGSFIYYGGGYRPGPTGDGQIYGSKSVWRYDPVANSYQRLPDLPTESGAGQLKWLAGKLHYFGGLDLTRTQTRADHYVLDLTGGATVWTLAAPLPLPRNHLGSAVLGGKIYAIGGQTGNNEGLTTHNEVWAYDPTKDEWTAVQSMPFGRGHIPGSTIVMGGRIVVVGGETSHAVPTSQVIAYDPDTDRWTTLTSLPEARSSGVAIAVDDEHFVYSAGNRQGLLMLKSGWRATLR